MNTSLTDLNLYGNDLGPEGDKAIAKSLEVDLPIFNVTLYSVTLKRIFFVIPFGNAWTGPKR